MKFENDLTPPASTWSTVRDHLPLLLLGGGVVAVFLGLHMAATGVVAIAALHLVAGLVAFGSQQLRKARGAQAEAR